MKHYAYRLKLDGNTVFVHIPHKEDYVPNYQDFSDAVQVRANEMAYPSIVIYNPKPEYRLDDIVRVGEWVPSS